MAVQIRRVPRVQNEEQGRRGVRHRRTGFKRQGSDDAHHSRRDAGESDDRRQRRRGFRSVRHHRGRQPRHRQERTGRRQGSGPARGRNHRASPPALFSLNPTGSVVCEPLPFRRAGLGGSLNGDVDQLMDVLRATAAAAVLFEAEFRLELARSEAAGAACLANIRFRDSVAQTDVHGMSL
ncbi:hypothetical protein NITMOv2_3604 [Nitrospira moscoviensis]|uniref:Uncharacterized protein n=1 Tax=Nitrospira moscoviensis TaxID=42253 RepID=A0A0K2GGC9_NITMO|nr:hypothetical protein NITMOv2_3604 [Nitrospira moscoviensis]